MQTAANFNIKLTQCLQNSGNCRARQTKIVTIILEFASLLMPKYMPFPKIFVPLPLKYINYADSVRYQNTIITKKRRR